MGQWIVVTAVIFAVLTITARTLYQKMSLSSAHLSSAAALQNAGAALIAAGLALVLGEHRFVAAPQLWASLAWGIAMLSGVATTLLVWRARRGDASRATTLLFLMPPLAALESYLAFGRNVAAGAIDRICHRVGGRAACSHTSVRPLNRSPIVHAKVFLHV